MIKEVLHNTNDTVSPYEFIERDIDLYGEDYLLQLDEHEFLINYGITKDEFLNEFSVNLSAYRKEKLIFAKVTPLFNDKSFEKFVEDFKNESIKFVSKPRITSEGGNRSRRTSPSPVRTSVRPSDMQEKSAKKNSTASSQAEATATRGFKPAQKTKKQKPAKQAPYPAPQPSRTESGVQGKLKKEYRALVKGYLKSSKSPLARRRINLHDKAFKSAALEAGVHWGTEAWFELLLKFFPGTDKGFFTQLDESGDDQQPTLSSENGDQGSRQEESGDQEGVNEASEGDSSQGEAQAQEESGATSESGQADESTQTSNDEDGASSSTNGASNEGASGESANQSNSSETEIKEQAIQQEMVNISDIATHADGEDFVNGIKDEKPTGFIAGIKNSAEPLKSSQEAKHDSIAEKIPELPTPTGLEPTDAEIKPPEGESAVTDTSSEVVNTTESLQNKPVGETLIPETQIPQDRLIDKELKLDSDVSEDVAIQQIEKLPSQDNSIETNPGAPPDIPLTGDSNPENADIAKQKAEQETQAQKTNADKAANTEIQIQNIAPPADSEVLTTELSELEPPPVIGDDIKIPTEVPEDIQKSFDVDAQAHIDEQAAEEYANHDQAITDLEDDSEAERQAKLDEIDSETESTKQEQLAAQAEAQSDTDKYKEEWKAENDAVISEFEASAEEEYGRTKKDIDSKVEEANKENKQIYADAEVKAQAEQQKAETQADEKKEEATNKKKGFWSKVTGAIGDFFDKVKEGLNAIFDAMRQAVKSIIDKAKKLAAAVIDLARDFIVAAIKFFGEALKAFVNIALAAFPELAKKFNNLIDKAVDFAVDKVNQLAEGLKKVVNALLDLLGKVLDKIIAAYQAVLNAILDVLEFIAVGIIKILQGLANIGISIAYAVGELKGAVVKEFIGEDITSPLPSVETNEQELPILESMKNSLAGSLEQASEMSPEIEAQLNSELDNKSMLDDDDFMLDGAENTELDPELVSTISLQLQDGGTLELGGSSDPVTAQDLQEFVPAGTLGTENGAIDNPEVESDNTGGGVEGLDADTMKWVAMQDGAKLDWHIDQMGAESGEPEPQSEPEPKPPANEIGSPAEIARKTGRLGIGDRLNFVGRQMIKGMQMWWGKNKTKVYLGLIGILLVAGVVAFFTGGAGLIPLLQLGIQALTVYFIADAILKIKGHLWDWLSKAWDGKAEDGGKSLATALAIIFSEFLFEYVLKGIGKVIKKIKNMVKATKTFKKISKVASKVGTGIKKTLKRATRPMRGVSRRGGKFVMKMKKGWQKGAKKLGDLRERILKKFGFKRIWIEKAGRWIELWGEFNSKVLLSKTDADGNTSYELHDVNRNSLIKNSDGKFDFDSPLGDKTGGTKVKPDNVITVREPHPDFPNIYREKKKVKLDDGTLVDVDYYNRQGVREDLIDTFPSGKPKNATEFAGKEMPLPDNLRSKYGDNIPFTEDGYPDFESVMNNNRIISEKIENFPMSGNSAADIAMANKMTSGFSTKNPVGFEKFTWHHLHDGKTMILVPTDLHSFVKHNGGDAITRAVKGL